MLTSTICASCKPHFRTWEAGEPQSLVQQSHTASQIPVSKNFKWSQSGYLLLWGWATKKLFKILVSSQRWRCKRWVWKWKQRKIQVGSFVNKVLCWFGRVAPFGWCSIWPPPPSSKCSRWPRELPLGNWILSTGLTAGTTPHALSSRWTQTRFAFFSDQL